MKTAQQGAEKWQRKLAAAAPDYRTGVASTSKDPTAAAAAAVGVWEAKVTSQQARDKYVRKLQGVTKADWQKSKTDAQIKSAIENGAKKEGAEMDPYKDKLDAAQIDGLVQYITASPIIRRATIRPPHLLEITRTATFPYCRSMSVAAST